MTMRIALLWIGLGCLLGDPSFALDSESRWRLAESRGGEAPVALFVETQPTTGRPAFKLETSFDVSPPVAAGILMEGMVSASDVPRGQRRRVLERSEREALVYTFIDLPFMLADRELALRIVHSDDPGTGIHRVEWREANDVLPPEEGGVVRLQGATGYWEFRPDGLGGCRATHLTQTEIGGSIPASIGHRLMRGQAVDSVERLRLRIRQRRQTHVAAPPPDLAPTRGRGAE